MSPRKPVKSNRPLGSPGSVKRDLLKAAIRLLSTLGREAATARAICNEVGVGAPTLYHHYGDLAGLHKAAINEAFRQMATTYRRTTKTKGPLQGIRDIWTLFIHFAHEEPLMCRIIIQHILAGDPPKAVDGILRSIVKDLSRMKTQVVLNYTPKLTAQLLWVSALGTVCFTSTEQGNSTPAYPAVQESMIDAILNSLFATKKSAKKSTATAL